MADLSPTQKLALSNHINALMRPDFEKLVYVLGAPNHVLPSSAAAQGDRSSALLQWVNSPNGCGMDEFLSVLAQIAPLPDGLKAPPSTPATAAQPANSALPPTSAEPAAKPIQIFLAHASEDKAQVIELYDRLKQRGYKPWLDKKDLIPGMNWRDAIPKAINESQIFIACLSKLSVSKQGYIQREFRMALQKLADQPPGAIYCIPLRLDDCEIPNLRQNEYGVNFRDYQWLDYFEADGFERLEHALQHQFG